MISCDICNNPIDRVKDIGKIVKINPDGVELYICYECLVCYKCSCGAIIKNTKFNILRHRNTQKT
jgi:hypothetical protein